MKKTVVCYQLKTPITFDGVKFYDHFLSYYTSETIEQAQADCDKMNKEKPSKLWNGKIIDWNEIDYFYASEQEEMCD